MQLKAPWKPFNPNDFEEGLFWFLVESPVYDVDVDDGGSAIGSPTGELKRRAILAWLFGETELHLPEFDVVDRENTPTIDHEDKVIAFAEAIAPSYE